MFKKTLLTLVALLATLQMSAAPVDVSAAKAKAKQYLASQVYAGKLMTPAATEPVLIKTEMGKVNRDAPVFYIFNTSTTFVVVSADDRAEEILAVGDMPLDIENIPCNMQAWLNTYKEQLDWLLSNPDAQVEKPVSLKAPGAKSVTYGPLLTCNWNQTAPYWNQCKFTYNDSTYQCYTGCCATSAAMVMYYWMWPTTQVDAIPSYTEKLSLSPNNSVYFTYPSLPATIFDWANMKNNYKNGYTTPQGDAVATLMRYVGQAEQMRYGTPSAGGSGSFKDRIRYMFIRFGYDSSTCKKVDQWRYSETAWAALIRNELAAGRPIVYGAYDANNGGGHVFNVDGYRDSDNKYHVNFGWGGSGNAWCAMNSFSALGCTFSLGQDAIIGIKPTADYFVPRIITSDTALTMEGIVGQSTTSTFTVTGSNFTSDVTLSVSSDEESEPADPTQEAVLDCGSCFSVSPTTITASEAAAGKTVTVTFAPATAGMHTGTITLKSTGSSIVTVSLTGTAKNDIGAPVLNAASNINPTGFTATWAHISPVDVTYTLRVMRNGELVQAKTGITGKSYTVTGLTAGYTYDFQVKAVPTNTILSNESDWSNKVEVTTLGGIPGDVNGDYEVSIADVTVLIDIIQSGNSSSPNYGRADVNGDGEVNISDVTALIDIILHN